jgi:hypothetical protein
MRLRDGLKALLVMSALLACKKAKREEASAGSAATPSAVAAPATPAAPAPAEPSAAPAKDDPIPDIPEGRSAPPTVAEWSAADEINTQEANSQPDKCFLKVVREWLKVHCDGEFGEITDMDGFGKENADYFQFIKPGKSADYVVRLRKGKALKLKIHRAEGNAALFVNWPGASPKPTIIALGKGR